MAYDENLARRIEELIKDNKNFAKKKMFGGVGYVQWQYVHWCAQRETSYSLRCI